MREVDLELLADHLGGALDGTPEGDRVAGLIATDPRWASAAARLSGALDAVAADLARLPDPTLPDDVAARLEEALRHAGAENGAARHRAGESPLEVPAGRRRPPRQARSTTSPPATRKPPRRRRAARWGAGLAVAAAAAGFAAFGVGNLNLAGDDAGVTPTLGSDVPTTEHGADLLAAPLTLASGTDYQRTLLPTDPPSERLPLAPRATQQQDGPGVASQPDAEQDTAGEQQGVPATLQHLLPLPPACQEAVLDGYAEGVTELLAVDYAYFEGRPALLIWLTTADDGRWVTVAGPQCGAPGAGADEQYRVAVR